MKKNGAHDLSYYLGLRYAVRVVECEEGGYFVEIPDLPGCMTQGETMEEALKNINEARELWLESAFEDKVAIPLPIDDRKHSGNFVVRLPASLHTRLAVNAEREGVSLNQYVASLLAERNALKEIEALLRERGRTRHSGRELSSQFVVADAPRKKTRNGRGAKALDR